MSNGRIDDRDDALDEFEQSLSALVPGETSLSRDELMFAAGRASALHEVANSTSVVALQRSFWPLATAASWLVTLTVLTLMFQPRANSQPMLVEEPVLNREQPHETVNETQTLATSPQPDQQFVPASDVSLFVRDLLPEAGELTPVALMKWRRGYDLDGLTNVPSHRSRQDSPPPTYAHLSAEMFDFTGDGSR